MSKESLFKIEYKKIFLDDLTKVFDYKFLYDNVEVDCCNSPDEISVFHNGEINDWVYFDELDNINNFKFDSIKCLPMHGFGGTTFSLYFMLNDDFVLDECYVIGKNIEHLKERKIDKINKTIEWIESWEKRKTELLSEIEKIKKM